MRYIAEVLHPGTNRPKAGTSGVVTGHYQSDANAMRYLALRLRNGAYPAGQYKVSIWPSGPGPTGREVGTLYKQASLGSGTNGDIA
jgi:hypothetical protein